MNGKKTMKDEYIRKQDAMQIAFKSPFFSDALMEEIESLPPADVVPVVRCDDCVYYGSRRWCELHSNTFDDNAFCSYGERREE